MKKILNVGTVSKQLHSGFVCDKVLHYDPEVGVTCNTLSRGENAYRIQDKSSSRFSFRNTAVLDDRTPFSRTELFHPVDQTFSKSGGVLQQLHP